MIGTTYSTTHYDEFKRTGNQNIFEEVIDSMVLDGVSGMNESFKKAISNLPRSEKRMTILSLLDKDLNLFKKIKALTNKDINRLDHIKDVIIMLRDYVKVGDVEKKKFGEVMTPLSLVKEMLSTLPEETWSNPNLKILDPANGTGPYPAVVIYKLMKGLENWEPDTEKRYKHIIENMIYTCELQAKNVFLWLCVADPFDEYETNTYWGSFLDEGFDKHMKEVWGVDKFDIVVGNPPYQDNNKNGGFQPKNHNLWSKFIIESGKKLNISGLLIFVTPDSWRSPSSKILDIFKRNTLLKIEFDVAKYFPGVGSTFSYYLLKIGKFDDKCKIYDSYINMNRLRFIPNGGKIGLSIHLKTTMSENQKIKLLCDTTSNHSSSKKSQLSKSITSENIYKVYHTNAQTFYSTVKSKHHDYKKVYFTISGYFIPKYDNGHISTSEICPYIIVDDEKSADNLLSFLNSKLYRFLIKSGKWSGFLNKDVLRLLPNMDCSKRYTDREIYDFFKLTEDEIDFIEKMNL